jgi:hypothetical protein
MVERTTITCFFVPAAGFEFILSMSKDPAPAKRDFTSGFRRIKGRSAPLCGISHLILGYSGAQRAYQKNRKRIW